MAITWSPTTLITGNALTGLSNGNLTAQNSGAMTFLATVGKSAGKWYFEVVFGGTANVNTHVGVATLQHSQSGTLNSGFTGIDWRGDKAIIASGSTVATSASVPEGTIGIAFDATQRKVWFAANNAWILSGDPANNLNPTVSNQPRDGLIFFPACSPNITMTAHFAEADFTYAKPAGFSALTEPSDWDGLINVQAIRNHDSDVRFGGYSRITGTVTELGVAGRYRVRLFDRVSARCIRETWSAMDGSYSFPYIVYRANGYFVIAYDHGDNPLNAAIADLVTPEPMP